MVFFYIIGKKGVNASDTSGLICEIKSENAMNCKLEKSWYHRFESDDMTNLGNLKSGRHRPLSLELINDTIACNPPKSTRILLHKLNIPTKSGFSRS